MHWRDGDCGLSENGVGGVSTLYSYTNYYLIALCGDVIG